MVPVASDSGAAAVRSDAGRTRKRGGKVPADLTYKGEGEAKCVWDEERAAWMQSNGRVFVSRAQTKYELQCSEIQDNTIMQIFNNSVNTIAKNALLLRSLAIGGDPTAEEYAMLADIGDSEWKGTRIVVPPPPPPLKKPPPPKPPKPAVATEPREHMNGLACFRRSQKSARRVDASKRARGQAGREYFADTQRQWSAMPPVARQPYYDDAALVREKGRKRRKTLESIEGWSGLSLREKRRYLHVNASAPSDVACDAHDQPMLCPL